MIAIALALNVIVFVAVVFFLYGRGYLSIYSGLFLYVAFHFVAFVQRPLVVYLFDLRSEFEFMMYMPTEAVFLQTILVANLGFLSFVFCYLAALRFQPIAPQFTYVGMSQAEVRSFQLSFLILSPLILYSFFLALTMRQAYGIEVFEELGKVNMTVDPTTGHHLFNDTTAYVVNARSFAFAFSALLIQITRGRWWSYLAILFCAFVALQLGERWALVIAGLVASMMTLYLNKRRNFTLLDYLGMAVVLGLFVLIGQNRDTVVRFLLTGELDIKFDLATSSFGAHPDFANFDFLTYVIAKVPDVSGTYSYFTQYLGIFTQPIPRVFWPDKPVGSPIQWVNLESYGRFASRTPSLVGDGWMSMGYPGVVITMGAVGAFFAYLFRRFCQPSVSIYFYCAYFWIVALLLQWARDGGYKILDFTLFSIGPLFLAYSIKLLLLDAKRKTGRKPRTVS
jgi:oligosaccharide repeat unit polymerase